MAHVIDCAQIGGDEQPAGRIIVRKALSVLESLPQLAGRGEGVELALYPCATVEFDNALAIC
jgi:hypothetical protein